MANTIPKLRIDPKALNKFRQNLLKAREGETIKITAEQRQAVITLILCSKRKAYPSQMQLDLYLSAMDKLRDVDPQKEPARFNELATEIEKFENQYCK